MKKIIQLCAVLGLIMATWAGYQYVTSNIIHPDSASNNNHHDTKDGHEMTDIHKTPPGLIETRDKLIALLDPHNPDTIFTVIDTIQADPQLSLTCHDIAHDVGHEAYKMYGFVEAMTFNNPKHVMHPLPQYICAGGYMHGILEQLSLDKPDFLLEPEIICDQVPRDARSSCFHGVGHVFMMGNHRAATTSVANCRVIKENMDMYRCFEGVRMEQFWGKPGEDNPNELGWDPTNPLDTCITVQDDEKPTCFLYATFGYLRFHPKDYFGAASACTASELPPLDAEFCLKGLGMTMMSKFKGEQMERSEIYVQTLAENEKKAFYEGVTGYARLSGLSESELHDACAKLSEDEMICIEALANYQQ